MTYSNVNANTNSPDQIIKTVDGNYQLSLFMSLRGHIAFKAVAQMGMYIAKQNAVTNRAKAGDLEGFKLEQESTRGDEIGEQLMHEAGMTVQAQAEWYEDIASLIRYSNKLTYDMQELADPSETKRADPSFKQNGIWFNMDQREESWKDTLKLIAQRAAEDETYGQYAANYLGDPKEMQSEDEWLEDAYAAHVKRIGHPAFAMSKPSFIEMAKSHKSVYEKFTPQILEALLDVGTDECDFDELSLRAQIACIENCRDKLERWAETAVKSVRFMNGMTFLEKQGEAATIRGLILKGFDLEFRAMLSSTRYANLGEFMRNFVPGTKESAIVSRRSKEQDVLDAVKAAKNAKLSDAELARLDTLESDVI